MHVLQRWGDNKNFYIRAEQSHNGLMGGTARLLSWFSTPGAVVTTGEKNTIKKITCCLNTCVDEK